MKKLEAKESSSDNPLKPSSSLSNDSDVGTRSPVRTRDSSIIKGKASGDSYLAPKKNTAIMHSRMQNLRKDISVNVKNIMGKVTVISIWEGETIQILKERIGEEEGISPDSQMLVFCGRQLEDNDVLKNVGIQDQSNVQLVLKMAGGFLYFHIL